MSSSKQMVGIFLFLAGLCFCLPKNIPATEQPKGHVQEIRIQQGDLLLGFALEIRHTKMDCTHLVHYLYQKSGLAYRYANSIALYEGVKEFRRVSRPEPGDVIVWRGHAGIVVDPDEHTFVSALRTGVKISSYVSHYWRRKGAPRFMHYVGDGAILESALVDP